MRPVVCAVTTALGLINNLAQVKIGQSLAVFGCGGVGLSVVQGAGSSYAVAASVCNLGLIPGELTLQAQPGAGLR